MAKETVPNRRYTDEFKLEALRLAESVRINQAAKRLGMPSSSLGNWARLKRSGKLRELPRAGPLKASPDRARGCRARLQVQISTTQPMPIPEHHPRKCSDFRQALFTLISKSVSKIPYPNPRRKLGRRLNNVNALCLP